MAKSLDRANGSDRSRNAGLFTATCFLLLIVTGPQVVAQANEGDREVSEAPSAVRGFTPPKIMLWANDEDAKTFVPPRVPVTSLHQSVAKDAATATFIVSYTGFTAEAQAAFQAAVDVWSQVLVSPVPIRVNAVFENLGSPYALGSAGPSTWANDGSYWYPIALSEKLSGFNQNGTGFDIDASFHSQRNDWYFGTDGNTPSGKYDFMSVVLHELGHGLGFIGFMVVDDGAGPQECDGIAGHGCNGYATIPAIFDQFTQDHLGRAITNTWVYPQDSSALGSVLRSGNVFFGGPAATAANDSNPPELYAPGSWEPGSSYSHVDEYVYGAGHPDSLMSPQLSSAEAIHDPGPITRGIFEDMGWTVNEVTSDTIFSDGFELGTTAWSATVQ